MARRDRQRLKQAVFEFFADGEVHHADEVEDAMARRFNLSQEERNEIQRGGRETWFHNSCGWCTWSLTKRIDCSPAWAEGPAGGV